jgi:hypothetical protein
MCEINPAHKQIFRLEFFTSNPYMTEARWRELVLERLLELEQAFNKTGEIRVHIHEVEE